MTDLIQARRLTLLFMLTAGLSICGVIGWTIFGTDAATTTASVVAVGWMTALLGLFLRANTASLPQSRLPLRQVVPYALLLAAILLCSPILGSGTKWSLAAPLIAIAVGIGAWMVTALINLSVSHRRRDFELQQLLEGHDPDL